MMASLILAVWIAWFPSVDPGSPEPHEMPAVYMPMVFSVGGGMLREPEY